MEMEHLVDGGCLLTPGLPVAVADASWKLACRAAAYLGLISSLPGLKFTCFHLPSPHPITFPKTNLKA